MIGLRTPRTLLPIGAALGLATWAALTVLVLPSSAVQIEDRGTSGLDGKVVMSPATERIETVEVEGGEQVSPGATVERAIILHNRTEQPIDFDLDVAQVVGSTSELVVEVRHGVREGAAAWVELETNSLRLEPGEQGTVGVTVRIPDDIKPGSKPFAVTATQRSGPVESAGAGIAPQFKQVAIFVLELPGDAPVDGRLTKATITSAQKSLAATRDGESAPTNARWYVSPGWADTHRLTLQTEYQNDGERLLTPSGKVVVRDVFGRVAARFDIKQFTVYPEGEAAGTVELKGLPSLGVFTASVELESEAAGKQNTTLPRFVFVPKWFLLAVGAFLLYGLYRLARWQLRRRREWKAYLREAEAEQGGAASAPDQEGDWDGSDPADDDDSADWAYDEEPGRP